MKCDSRRTNCYQRARFPIPASCIGEESRVVPIHLEIAQFRRPQSHFGKHKMTSLPLCASAHRKLQRRLCRLPKAFHIQAEAQARLKSLKNQPKTRSHTRVNQSFGASCGLSSSAQRAGASVSELKAEINVDTAIVIANWR